MKKLNWPWFVIALALLIASTGLSAAPQTHDGKWAKEFEAGTEDYERCDFGGAREHLERALQAARKFDLGDERAITTLDKLGLACLADGDLEAAEQAIRRAGAIAEVRMGRSSLDYAEYLQSRGVLVMTQTKGNKYSEAESFFERALQLREKLLPKGDPTIAESLSSVADLDIRQGRYDKADSLLHRVLSIRDTALGHNHPAVAQTLSDLGRLRAAQGRNLEAEAAYQEAVGIYKELPDPPACEFAVTLKNYAALLRAENRGVEADQLEAQSIAMVLKPSKK